MLEALRERGALFPPDLASLTGLLPSQVEEALWDGVARGLITADGFRAVRSLFARRAAQAAGHASGRPGCGAAASEGHSSARGRPGAGRCCPSPPPTAILTTWPRRSPSNWPRAGAWSSVT